MRFSNRRRILGLIIGAAVVIPASIAWACVGIVVFRVVGSPTVQPGGTVQVFGGEFARGKPVEVRLDSPSGRLLATHPNPLPSTMTSRFTLDVPIPNDITPGEHLLVATQNHYDMNSGIPARAAIYVNTPEPAPPTPESRPTSIVASEGPSTGSLVLIGLGVAAGGLLLAAVWSLMAARKPSTEAGSAQAT